MTTQDRNFWPSKITIKDRNFGLAKITIKDHAFEPFKIMFWECDFFFLIIFFYKWTTYIRKFGPAPNWEVQNYSFRLLFLTIKKYDCVT